MPGLAYQKELANRLKICFCMITQTLLRANLLALFCEFHNVRATEQCILDTYPEKQLPQMSN